MTQDEWLFKIAEIPIKNKKMYNYYGSGYSGYLNATLAPKVDQLSEVERLRIIEKMKNYWKEHKSSSLEFLVNDAIVNCDKGSIMSRVKGKDHGVYTDHDGGLALLNEDDRKLVETDLTVFGSCACEVGKKNKCKAKNFSKWYGVNSNTHIGKGKASLIMSSYMICPYYKNAYIRPVTSGQEFTFTESLFKYPKFVVEQGMEHAYFNIEYWNKYNFEHAKIDMTVIRKLAIRNISIMNQGVEGTNTKGYYERKWIEYLAKYILLCEDKKILCNIVNEFYNRTSITNAREIRCNTLVENYDLLFESAKIIRQYMLNKYINDDVNIIKVMQNFFLLSMIKYCLKPYITKFQEKTILYIDNVNTNSSGAAKYYKGGIDIQYFAYDSATMIRRTTTYISKPRISETTTGLPGLWEYFEKNRDGLFVGLLILNLAATAAIIAIPTVAGIIGVSTVQASNIANIASVVWTIGGSFLGEKLEGDETKKFEKTKYKQTRSGLSTLLSRINAYIIYTNQGEQKSDFLYEVYPSGETDTLISNFLINISRIYIKRKEKHTKEKCLINILKLDVLLGKQLPIMTKINCLIAALTIKALTNFDLFEAEDISRQESKDATMTGIEMLENLIAPVVDSVDYKVEIQSGDIRIDIDKTLYVDKNGEVNISKLFTTIL